MKQLKLGVGRRTITPSVGGMLAGYAPPRPSTCVHDDVHVIAFAFETEGKQALLFSCELTNFLAVMIPYIKGKLTEATGVPADHIMLSCTHTHSGPHTIYDYDEPDGFVHSIFIPRAIEAAQEALGSMKAAQMGVGTTWSDVGVNRRQIREDTGTIKLGQNPYGSFDPTMTVLAFREPDGTPIANLVHYGCHNTGSGKNSEISRDWAGVMLDRLEEQTGAVSAFINGCGGDCGPRLPNGKTTGDLKMALELGGKAGIDAVKAYNSIQVWQDAPMQVLYAPLKLPLRDIGTAEDVLAEMATYGDPAQLKGTNVGSYRQLQERYEYLKAGNVPPTEEAVPHIFIALGNVVLEGIPFEPFSITTLRIREHSPFRHTLCVGYTNGSRSYFPSMDQIIRGGYEVKMFRTRNLVPFADDAEQAFVTESLKHIRSLYENR